MSCSCCSLNSSMSRWLISGSGSIRSMPQHGALDEVDAGRLQRLHEPARQADRDAVAMPLLAPCAGGEGQVIGLGQRLALDISHQPFERGSSFEELAAKDDAVADAMLQRDAPLPTLGMRRWPA